MGKVYTAAVIGCGSRGRVYGDVMNMKPDKFKVIAVCDLDEVKRKKAQEFWNVTDENAYDDEKEFFKEKRADVLVIATQDRDHVRMTTRAMELGYDILLEKPISPFLSELEELLETNKKYNRKVAVCHVLRYAPAFVKIKEIMDSGIIGRLVHIENTEQVEYWHQAHSFVRGNWRDENTTSPMIMQKCCHDFDLIQFYAGAKCDSVYSVGSNAFFNKNNKPEGSADRCENCKYINDCAYSSELYIHLWKKRGSPEYGWPFNVVCPESKHNEEILRKALRNNEYGKCVFACDNNVVDNQSVEMVFENGVRATHTMSAFTGRMGRRMILHGTLGEIELCEDKDTLTVYPFGKDTITYKVSELIGGEDEFGHGGGDLRLIDDLYNVISGEGESATSLESSVESHLIALAAEKSRKEEKIVHIHKNK